MRGACHAMHAHACFAHIREPCPCPRPRIPAFRRIIGEIQIRYLSTYLEHDVWREKRFIWVDNLVFKLVPCDLVLEQGQIASPVTQKGRKWVFFSSLTKSPEINKSASHSPPQNGVKNRDFPCSLLFPRPSRNSSDIERLLPHIWFWCSGWFIILPIATSLTN